MTDDDDLDLDCTAVIRELYTFLDGEMAENENVEFTRHLHGCVDCHEAVAFHAELKMVISTKCRDQVPEALKLRIAAALGLTSQLRPEYGDQPRRLDGP